MGRHFEVRAAAMAKSGARKSALYARASREIYMAAKSGLPDPKNNLALRSAIDKFKGQSIPRDVIDRAIKKAVGGDVETYTAGRYEAFGPGNSFLIIDSLTDNANRAFVEIRTAVTKKGGHMGTVNYNFTETGIIVFNFDSKDLVEETLVLGDVDVRAITSEEGVIEVLVEPSSFGQAKDLLNSLGIEDLRSPRFRCWPMKRLLWAMKTKPFFRNWSMLSMNCKTSKMCFTTSICNDGERF